MKKFFETIESPQAFTSSTAIQTRKILKCGCISVHINSILVWFWNSNMSAVKMSIIYKRILWENVPSQNMSKISGLPQPNVATLWLKTESNSTGLTFHPWKYSENLKNIAYESEIKYKIINLENGRRIFIESSNNSNVARSWFCWNCCMSNTPSTLIFNNRPEEKHISHMENENNSN